MGKALASDGGDGAKASKSEAVKAAKEAGIDISDLEIAEGNDESDVPAITMADGSDVDEDAVPAAEPEQKGKKLSSMTNFPALDEVDPETIGDIAVSASTPNLCEIGDGGETVTYRFTAPKTATFIFWSDSSTDTCGRILDADGNEIYSNDDGGNGNNFRIEFPATSGQTYYLQVNLYNTSNTGQFDVYIAPDEYTASINVKTYKASGNAYITGTATGDTFYDIYVDGSRVYSDISGKTSFAYTLDMKNYDVGFHTISAELSNHAASVTYRYAVPTYIYSKPSIKRSHFTTGSKYFVFENSGNSYSKDSSCKVYLDYKKKGGKWKNNYGPVDNYSSGKKKSLKPNTWYYVRAHYGKKVSYGGKTYFFTGKETGKKSANVKIKTGKKSKPPVKSITITKAKQFSRTYSYTTWIYIGGYGYPTYHTYTQWYTSFKVTVKMKKKPGAKGIYIGNVRCKGNKKKYTADFTVTGKQKGKKLKVAVCTYQSPIYMAYSPSYTKKVKVRK